MKEVFDEYLKLKHQIVEEFQLNDAYYSDFDISTEYYWEIKGHSIVFGEDQDEYEYYENEVLTKNPNYIKRKEDYTAVFCGDGCGNYYWMILDNAKEMKSIEIG